MISHRLKVLVTGANGFIGKVLCQHLLDKGVNVIALAKEPNALLVHPQLTYFQIENINGNTDWGTLLEGVDVVVHLASRVHHMKDKGMQALKDYQETNVQGTQQLAIAAIKSNVKRFIYMSTIKVNAEKTFQMPLRAEDQPQPKDAYSLSKLQGEQILQEESRRSGMEWVIIRPPLVYGPQVKGNFKKLLALARSPFPLPFASISNRRSFVSVQNLCSFIECCLTHPYANGEVLLVSDNQDLSTPELVKILRKAEGRRGWLFPFPLWALKCLGILVGKRKEVDRLLDSLQVNIEKSMRLLNWQPAVCMEEALKALSVSEQQQKKEGVVNGNSRKIRATYDKKFRFFI